MIHIKYINRPDLKTSTFINEYKDVLYASLDSINNYRIEFDNTPRLVSRAILLKQLMDEGASAEKLLEIKRNKNGKPLIKGFMEFSISHSKEMVAVGFNDEGPIGLDVQYHKQVDFKVFETLFNPNEIKHVKHSLDPQKSFYEVWTAKEAVVKFFGLNLGESITDIQVSQRTFRYGESKGLLYKMHLFQNYTLSIAYRTQTEVFLQKLVL